MDAALGAGFANNRFNDLETSALLFAAVQWRAARLPLGFEVRLDPAQGYLRAPASDHFARLQVLGGLVLPNFALAIGASALSSGEACEVRLPPGGGSAIEECLPTASITFAGRLRVGSLLGHHGILRVEAIDLVRPSARNHHPLSIGASGNLAITERLHLIADGELRVLAGHLDVGVRYHLARPGAVGTLALVARVGWQSQWFERYAPVSLAGPRAIFGAEWSL